MFVEFYTRSQGKVKVVNIGGPLDNFRTPRSQRPDFRHVALNPGLNTIVANVNEVRLETIFRGRVDSCEHQMFLLLKYPLEHL